MSRVLICLLCLLGLVGARPPAERSEDLGATAQAGYLQTRLEPHYDDFQDGFAEALAISADSTGRTIAVGWPNESGNQGAVLVFEMRGGPLWVTRLVAPHGNSSSEFGRSVAIDGDTLVVGAHDNELGSRAGAAYIFHRDPRNWSWSLDKKLLAPDGGYEDWFGLPVVLEGDTLLVGAGGHIHESNLGSVYVFYRDRGGPDNWGEVTELIASTPQPGTFGNNRVRLLGDLAAVASHLSNYQGVVSAGVVFLFERNAGGPDAWGEIQILGSPNPGPDEWFGVGLSLQESLVAVGAPQDGQVGFRAGAAYLFDRDLGGPGEWGLVKQFLASDGVTLDRFGGSVALMDDDLLVGSGSTPTGSVYVFRQDWGGSGNWGEVGKILPIGTQGRAFGGPIETSGSSAVVGAPKDQAPPYGVGSAYLLWRDDGTPRPLSISDFDRPWH